MLLRKTKHLCKFLGNKWVNFFQIKENIKCFRDGLFEASQWYAPSVTVVSQNHYGCLPERLQPFASIVTA